MSHIPVFSGEVSVYEDPTTGLRIECSEKHVPAITSYLTSAGFTCGKSVIAVRGTSRIHNFVEFQASGGTFDELSQAIAAHLQNAGVDVAKESFNVLGEKHVRFNLTNVSVFDK